MAEQSYSIKRFLLEDLLKFPLPRVVGGRNRGQSNDSSSSGAAVPETNGRMDWHNYARH